MGVLSLPYFSGLKSELLLFLNGWGRSKEVTTEQVEELHTWRQWNHIFYAYALYMKGFVDLLAIYFDL